MASFRSFVKRVSWLIAAGPVSAFAGTPVQLPADQPLADWEEPLRIAGLHAADTGSAGCIQMVDLGETWALVYGDRIVRVPEPLTADSRADVALLARSLTRSLTLRAPERPVPPTSPVARDSRPTDASPPARSAVPPMVSPSPVPIHRPFESPPPLEWVAPDLGPQSLPWASVGPVQPVASARRRRAIAPWTSVGMTHRPRTIPSLQLAFGVDLLRGKHVGLSPVVSVHTERALQLPESRWYRRTLREADAGVSGYWTVHPLCRLDAAFIASFRGFTEQQRTVHREWMPRVAVGSELRLPGVRTAGLRMGLSSDLAGTQLAGGPLTEQAWLVPIEVSAALVVRLGSRDDPKAVASTPVRSMTPLPVNVLDVQ